MIQRPQSDYSTLGSHKLFRPYSQNRTLGAFFLLIGLLRNIKMMPGSKGLSPHELAHKWVKDLGTRPDMSIKVG